MKKLTSLFLILFFFVPFVFSQDLQLKIPQEVTSAEDKTEYCYRTQELLRLEHNRKGKDFREGKITEQEWKDWLETYFQPRSNAITVEKIKNKEAMKQSTKYSIDLEKDFEEKNITVTP